MNGLRAGVTAKVGPLPVWAWAVIGLALIIGFMYWKKIGFFAPASPADTSSQGSTEGSGMDPNFPLGVGGLAGGGNPQTPLAQTQVVPGMFDASSGSYAGVTSSPASYSGTPPAVDFSAGTSAASPFPIAGAWQAAQGIQPVQGGIGGALSYVANSAQSFLSGSSGTSGRSSGLAGQKQ